MWHGPVNAETGGCLFEWAGKGSGRIWRERTEDGGSYTNIFFQMENIESRAMDRDF